MIYNKHFLQALLVALLSCLSANAETFYANNEGKSIYYFITSEENRTCVVTKGDYEYSGEVVIPAEAENWINGNVYTVTGIKDYAFENNIFLKSVVLPESITFIGYHAFYGCKTLSSIEIPESVTSIGGYAFYGCEALTSIEFPESVTSIGGAALLAVSNKPSITRTIRK